MKTQYTKARPIYALGVLKQGNRRTPITAYGSTRYGAPTSQRMKYVNKSIVARSRVYENTSLSNKQRRQELKRANSIAHKGGYRYAGARTTALGTAAVYKSSRRAYRRTRRNYKGQFAGSY